MQWCQNVLHIQKLSAAVYSGRIGIDLAEITRSQHSNILALGSIQERIEEALSVHDRFQGLRDFTASIEQDALVVSMTIDTNIGAVSFEGPIPL
jgi:hypothetical protein